MNPSNHRIGYANPTPTVPSDPHEHSNGYYHATSQSMLQQVPVQRSNTVTMPYNGHSSNVARPSSHSNIDRRRPREHAVVAIPPYGQFPSYGLSPPPRYDVPSPSSISNNHGRDTNSSSGSSQGSSSSDIFHFSPPSSSEGRPTSGSSSRVTETGRFRYSPPPVDLYIQCNTCKGVMHTDELREHAGRCNGRLRSPGSGTVVLRPRTHNANGYHSGTSQQGTLASSSQHVYAHGTGNAIASTSHGYAYAANGAYTPSSQGGEMVPRAHYQADYSMPPFPPYS